jgi:hypothetical protein
MMMGILAVSRAVSISVSIIPEADEGAAAVSSMISASFAIA